MKIYSFLLVLGIFIQVPFTVKSQFYYKDIWNTEVLNKETGILKKLGIRQISTKSFEDDGTPSAGFYCEKKIDREFNSSQMTSTSYITGNSTTLTYYNDAGMVTKVIDSSSSSVNETNYKYEKAHIKAILTSTRSLDKTPAITERHEYFYSGSGQLEKMIRVKMDKPYSTTNFISDKKGNVIEENEIAGNSIKKYFYYYNDKNQLTDVVHNSPRVNKLLPDYIYEYDEKGNITQMISTEENSSNYFFWRYEVDNRNLRITEKCYSKEKRILGTITFQYR